MKAGDRVFIQRELKDRMGGSKLLIDIAFIHKLPEVEGGEYQLMPAAGEQKPFPWKKQVFVTRQEALRSPL